LRQGKKKETVFRISRGFSEPRYANSEGPPLTPRSFYRTFRSEPSRFLSLPAWRSNWTLLDTSLIQPATHRIRWARGPTRISLAPNQVRNQKKGS